MADGRGGDETASLLAARTAAASTRLREALHADVARFLGQQIEDRLRARPHFFARTPARALAVLRASVDTDASKLTDALERKIVDLRTYYGAASPARGRAEEEAGFSHTIAEDLVAATKRMLAEMAFPGDAKPDRADVTQMDLQAEYKLAYTASPSLLWAFAQLRELDEVRNQLADASGAPAPSFELRWHLPERDPAR